MIFPHLARLLFLFQLTLEWSLYPEHMDHKCFQVNLFWKIVDMKRFQVTSDFKVGNCLPPVHPHHQAARSLPVTCCAQALLNKMNVCFRTVFSTSAWCQQCAPTPAAWAALAFSSLFLFSFLSNRLLSSSDRLRFKSRTLINMTMTKTSSASIKNNSQMKRHLWFQLAASSGGEGCSQGYYLDTSRCNAAVFGALCVADCDRRVWYGSYWNIWSNTAPSSVFRWSGNNIYEKL